MLLLDKKKVYSQDSFHLYSVSLDINQQLMERKLFNYVKNIDIKNISCE